MPLVRLDKYISERTEHTRSQIKTLVQKGKVTVDGVIVKRSDHKIDDVSADVKECARSALSPRDTAPASPPHCV